MTHKHLWATPVGSVWGSSPEEAQARGLTLHCATCPATLPATTQTPATTDFVIIRGGVVAHRPEHVPVLNLDVLDDDFISDEVIEDARNLRDQVARLVEDATDPDDVHTLTAVLAECNSWLARH